MILICFCLRISGCYYCCNITPRQPNLSIQLPLSSLTLKDGHHPLYTAAVDHKMNPYIDKFNIILPAVSFQSTIDPNSPGHPLSSITHPRQGAARYSIASLSQPFTRACLLQPNQLLTSTSLYDITTNTDAHYTSHSPDPPPTRTIFATPFPRKNKKSLSCFPSKIQYLHKESSAKTRDQALPLFPHRDSSEDSEGIRAWNC